MCHLERMLAKHFCHAFFWGTFYPPETVMANDEEIVEFRREIANCEGFCEYLQETWKNDVESDHAGKESGSCGERRQPGWLQGLTSAWTHARRQDQSHDSSKSELQTPLSKILQACLRDIC